MADPKATQSGAGAELDYFDEYPAEDPFMAYGQILQHQREVVHRLRSALEEYLQFADLEDLLAMAQDFVDDPS